MAERVRLTQRQTVGIVELSGRPALGVDGLGHGERGVVVLERPLRHRRFPAEAQRNVRHLLLQIAERRAPPLRRGDPRVLRVIRVAEPIAEPVRHSRHSTGGAVGVPRRAAEGVALTDQPVQLVVAVLRRVAIGVGGAGEVALRVVGEVLGDPAGTGDARDVPGRIAELERVAGVGGRRGRATHAVTEDGHAAVDGGLALELPVREREALAGLQQVRRTGATGRPARQGVGAAGGLRERGDDTRRSVEALIGPQLEHHLAAVLLRDRGRAPEDVHGHRIRE